MSKYEVHYTQYDNELMPSPVKVQWETTTDSDKRWMARIGEFVVYVDLTLPVCSVDVTHMSYGISHHEFMSTNMDVRTILLTALNYLCVTHMKAIILITGGVWPEDTFDTAPLF